MKPITYYGYLLLIGILVSSCVSSNPTITPTWTETQSQAYTPLPLMSTNTPHPTQTVTLTPPATLIPDEAKETMRTLLLEPVDCLAPCFWDITPDQTTLGEAKNIFIRFGLIMENTSKIGNFEFYDIDYDFNSGLSISLVLTIQNGIVKNLEVGISPEPQKAGIPREWSAYSPETLINRYGTPSKVTFDDSGGPNPGYGMALYFDNVDLIVFYINSNLGPQLQTCPLIDQMRHIGIWMGKNPRFPPEPNLIPLETATSMTLEEFSKLMTGPLDRACFNLKKEVFP